MWGDLENKTNATSRPNIGLLKGAFQEVLRIYFEGM